MASLVTLSALSGTTSAFVAARVPSALVSGAVSAVDDSGKAAAAKPESLMSTAFASATWFVEEDCEHPIPSS